MADKENQQPAPADPEPKPEDLNLEAADAEPKPLEVPLEEQINDLPPLVYPGLPNEEFRKWAEEKRQGRLRLEAIGGGVLLVAGAAASVLTQRLAFVVIVLFAVIGLAVYELLVSSFE
jgi:hypothetical protein